MITKEEVLKIIENRIKEKLAKEKATADNFDYDHFLDKLSEGIRLKAEKMSYHYDFSMNPCPEAGLYQKDIMKEIIRRIEEAGFQTRVFNDNDVETNQICW